MSIDQKEILKRWEALEKQLNEGFKIENPLDKSAKVKGNDEGTAEAAKNTKDSNVVKEKPTSTKMDSPVKQTGKDGASEADHKLPGNDKAPNKDTVNKTPQGTEGAAKITKASNLNASFRNKIRATFGLSLDDKLNKGNQGLNKTLNENIIAGALESDDVIDEGRPKGSKNKPKDGSVSIPQSIETSNIGTNTIESDWAGKAEKAERAISGLNAAIQFNQDALASATSPEETAEIQSMIDIIQKNLAKATGDLAIAQAHIKDYGASITAKPEVEPTETLPVIPEKPPIESVPVSSVDDAIDPAEEVPPVV